jgi:hypothetical protein
MDLTSIFSAIASQGPWGLVCVVLIGALYKLFGYYEKARREQIEGAKASKEDSQKVWALTSELQQLLRDVLVELRDHRAGRR